MRSPFGVDQFIAPADLLSGALGALAVSLAANFPGTGFHKTT